MFCPSCGLQNVTESNFCKKCGTNLRAVVTALTGQAVANADDAIARENARMFLKRRGLLTGGIITTCVGVGVSLFLGVVGGGEASAVGLIPLMAGVGLILSGLLVLRPSRSLPVPHTVPGETSRSLYSAPPATLPGYQDSVTSNTTRILDDEEQPPERVTK